MISTESERKPLKKPIILGRLTGAWTHAWTHEAVNSRCAKWQIIVLIFFKALASMVLKKTSKVEITIPSKKKRRALFVSVNSPWTREFFVASSTLSTASTIEVSVVYISAVFFALLTCWHVQFSKIFAFLLCPIKINS